MKRYLKKFSYKEGLSILVSSFILLAIYFSVEVFMQEQTIRLTYYNSLLIFSTPLIISHRFFLIENGSRNRFCGRILHDLLITICSSILCFICTFSIGTIHLAGNFINLIIILFFGFFLTELTLSIINRVLIFFGCHVW